MSFGRTIDTKGTANFYTVLWFLWVALAVWQIANMFRFSSVFEADGSFGVIYVILTLALFAWSGWNAYDIGKDLLAYRAKVKEDD